MKVEGLTNDEVKSHLQKYRLHTRRAPNGSGATGNQPMVVMGGLWFQDNQYGTSKSQSESPQGPLQLARIIIPPKGVKTSWIMHEYRLADNNTSMKPPPVAADMGSKKGSLRPDEWVLCRIYKKNNSQRPEKEDSMDDMNSTIGMQNHRTMNSRALLDNAENLFDDLLDQDGMNGNSMSSQLAYSSSKPFNMVSSSRSGVYSLKHALPTPYWSEPNGSAKRFNANQQSMVMDGSSTITGLLNQFPQSVQYNQQALLGSIDDNVFGSPYPGMNWNSQ